MSMIELSYDNVNNGFRKRIHMTAWCPNLTMAEYVFRRAANLYCASHEATSYIMDLTIRCHEVDLQFKSWDRLNWDRLNETYNDSRGIHMIHPALSMNFTKQKDFDVYDDMQFRNERFLDQWRL